MVWFYLNLLDYNKKSYINIRRYGTMSPILAKVTSVSIGLFVAAILLPLSLTTMANANLTGVDATIATVCTVLLPVLAVIAIAMHFLSE